MMDTTIVNGGTILYEGTEIAFYMDGDPEGLPTVLLHGFCEESSMWDDLAGDLAGCRLLLVDMPGFGRSAVRSSYTIDWVAGALAAVMAHLEFPRAVVIGHSMGGYVSVALADLRPDLIMGLGLFHSHPFADSPEKRADRIRSMSFIHSNGTALYLKQMIPGLFAPLFATSNGYLINRLIFQANAYHSTAILAALEAMKTRSDRRQVLVDIKVPVLFIIGAQDKSIPHHLSLEQTCLPDIAEVHILPAEAHMGMYGYREKAAEIICSFTDFCRSYAALHEL